jgi:hypothetical protein
MYKSTKMAMTRGRWIENYLLSKKPLIPQELQELDDIFVEECGMENLLTELPKVRHYLETVQAEKNTRQWYSKIPDFTYQTPYGIRLGEIKTTVDHRNVLVRNRKQLLYDAIMLVVISPESMQGIYPTIYNLHRKR